MKIHVCEENTNCCCSSTAVEPNWKCPIHSGYRDRKCKHCGRYMKQNYMTYVYNKLAKQMADVIDSEVKIQFYTGSH